MLSLDYSPQPKQALLHESPAKLIFYGGAVGGGKSHALRWEAIRWCLMVPGIQVYLFRRTLPELEDNHIKIIRAEVPGELGAYNDTRKAFEFKNGSAINFCYCEAEKDVYRRQGSEIHLLLVDEAAQLTEFQLTYLIGRMRLGKFAQKVPEQYRDYFPRACFGSNPGGPGHNALKEWFINAAPPGELFHSKRFKGRLSVFIPARMDDNEFLDEDYMSSLAGLPPELLKAYTEGDWDAVVGQALPSLSRDPVKGHLLRGFEPPRHWTRFMSMDWGTAKPFSVGWYCVSDGAVLKEKEGWPERWIPSGAIIRYAEWYGWDGRADHGSYLESPSVAHGIVEREHERNEPPMDYRVGDSSMWSKTDGPSPAERMREAEPVMVMRPSQKDREHNYAEFIARLAGDEPMFYCTTNCRHFWRTVPPLSLDQNNPEKGPDTRLEDHVYDEVAYALRSMPMTFTEEDREEIKYRRMVKKHRGGGRYAT